VTTLYLSASGAASGGAVSSGAAGDLAGYETSKGTCNGREHREQDLDISYVHLTEESHARIRSTNMLERLFNEIKRRTRVVGVFPKERSASTLATEIALRSSEEWALRRYLTMDALQGAEKPNPQLSRH
jgi:hypothetical protein